MAPEQYAEAAPTPAFSGTPMRSSTGAASTDKTLHGETSWSDFRWLCRYYAECVRLDERPYLTAWQPDIGSKWAPLSAAVNWRAISGQGTVAIGRTDELSKVVRANATSNDLGTFVIGLAVDVFDTGQRRDSGALLRGLAPVLAVRACAELEGDRILLHGVGSPEINHQWLERKFRSRERRQALLDSLEVLPTQPASVEDDDEGAEPAEILAVASIEQTLERLFDQTRSMWQEPGDPSQLRSEPPLESIERPGIYNRAILMALPDLKYAKRLHQELHKIASEATDEDLERSALRVLFRSGSSASESQQQPTSLLLAEPILLNGDQRVAAEAGLCDDLAVVTGPPGTGKSTVVQTVLANLALRGRSALFASRNHQGLEAVEPRLNALVEPDRIMLRPVYPFNDSARRFSWQQVMVELLCRPARAGVLEARKNAVSGLDRLIAEQQADEALVARILDLRDELARANEAVHEVRQGLPPELASIARDELAAAPIRRIARAARIGICACQGAPRWARPFGGVVRWWIRRRLGKLARTCTNESLRRAVMLAASAPASRLPSHLATLELLARLVEADQDAEAVEAELRSQPAATDVRSRLDERRQQIGSETIEALKLVAASAGAGISGQLREELAALRAAFINHGPSLDANDPLRQRIAAAFSRAMPELLKHYPLWAVANLSVSKAIPLTPGMFDLVVIDEASQCDLPSIVPLLYRARRLLVVGDPMQLQHVTQLSRETDLYIRRRLGVEDFRFEPFSFRASSLFDLASTRQSAERIELLSHYRCHPAIADYCNDRFYNKTLWVRTSEDALLQRFASANIRQGCMWTDIRADIRPASRGCFNPAEIDTVVNELSKLAESVFGGSVGVVTPFRVQADRIRDRVHQSFDAAVLQRWAFIVDTADGFQGDERDLMLFSLVGGREMPEGSRGFLGSSPNRFNVAASRARAVLHVVGDAEWAGSCGIPYVEELLRRCRVSENRQYTPRSDLIGPVWEPRLADALRGRGLPVQQQYPAGGFFLDIALLGPDLRLNVEVDGERYHRDLATGNRRIDDVYRDTVLQALGWSVKRYWVYELREDFDGCVESICQAFHER